MFRFPFTNFHELNLDWILAKVKEFSELIPPMQTAVDDVQAALSDATEAITKSEEALENANEAVETANEAKEIAEQASQGVIPNGSVTTPKLADQAVTGSKIANGAVSTEQLYTGAVRTNNIYNGAVTGDKIASDAVKLSKINDDALSCIGYIINGNASSVSIPLGNYVIVKHSSITGVVDGLYKAIATIPANTAITSTYLSNRITNGGLNEEYRFINLTSNIAAVESLVSVADATVYKYGMLAIASFRMDIQAAITANTAMVTGLPPAFGRVELMMRTNAGEIYPVFISTQGALHLRNKVVPSTEYPLYANFVYLTNN